MTPAPLLVIDGDSIGHRAYHAMPPVPDDQGRPAGLLLGFANVLLATVDWVHPRAVLVALDSRERSYRHDLLPGYQGQRDPFPADLTEQLDALPELAGAFGFASAKHTPFEADDLLASGVANELARGGQAVVMTSDRDAYQLVGERSAVLVPSRAGKPPEIVDIAGVHERYGVSPEQVPDLIALRGDPSDAIPGARGIGAVGAADLLRRFGTLEGVIEHADELSARQRDSITSSADDLRRYLQVATMRRDLPVPELPDAGLDTATAAARAVSRGLGGLAGRLAARA
ncbi:MAG TPA: 5'-3' exonuclease [Gaiellales bacterium]